MNLKGKTIVITGASSGIGEACAYEFGKYQANIVLASRNLEKLNLVKLKVDSLGSKAICIPCDVTKEEDCKNLIKETVEQFGTIHVFINNAGISMRALFIHADTSVIKQVMDVNFWGAVYCTKFALPYLLKEKGSLVSISSFAGFKGLPARTGYAASKYALNGFMESLRIENRKTGLHIGILSPGYTTSNIRNVALNANGLPQKESPLNENKLMPASAVALRAVNMVIKRKDDEILTSLSKFTFIVNKFFPKFVDWVVYRTIAKEKDSPFH